MTGKGHGEVNPSDADQEVRATQRGRHELAGDLIEVQATGREVFGRAMENYRALLRDGKALATLLEEAKKSLESFGGIDEALLNAKDRKSIEQIQVTVGQLEEHLLKAKQTLEKISGVPSTTGEPTPFQAEFQRQLYEEAVKIKTERDARALYEQEKEEMGERGDGFVGQVRELAGKLTALYNDQFRASSRSSDAAKSLFNEVNAVEEGLFKKGKGATQERIRSILSEGNLPQAVELLKEFRSSLGLTQIAEKRALDRLLKLGDQITELVSARREVVKTKEDYERVYNNGTEGIAIRVDVYLGELKRIDAEIQIRPSLSAEGKFLLGNKFKEAGDEVEEETGRQFRSVADMVMKKVRSKI